MLLSDGSVTRHLELMLDAPVQVVRAVVAPSALILARSPKPAVQECLEMRETDGSLAALPKEVALIEGPHLQRQVYLRDASSGVALVFAASWWNVATVREHLRDASKPVWASLSATRTELFRDIRMVYHGTCPALEREFGTVGPFWGRDYIFWNRGKPLTVIHEVFSTGLSRYLAPDRL